MAILPHSSTQSRSITPTTEPFHPGGDNHLLNWASTLPISFSNDTWICPCTHVGSHLTHATSCESLHFYTLPLISIKTLSVMSRIDIDTGSSSFVPLNQSFSISYGSGSADGVLGRDVVRFSGFEVQDQVFGKQIRPPAPPPSTET